MGWEMEMSLKDTSLSEPSLGILYPCLQPTPPNKANLPTQLQLQQT